MVLPLRCTHSPRVDSNGRNAHVSDALTRESEPLMRRVTHALTRTRESHPPASVH